MGVVICQSDSDYLGTIEMSEMVEIIQILFEMEGTDVVSFKLSQNLIIIFLNFSHKFFFQFTFLTFSLFPSQLPSNNTEFLSFKSQVTQIYLSSP